MSLEAVDVSFGYGLKAGAPASRSREDHGAGVRVIDDVSLSVTPGSLLGVLGPNGSGKTTLLKLLSAALRPTGGRISLDGTLLTSVPRRALAKRMAVVPQETRLAFDYTALEIVLMGRYPHLGAFEVEGPADIAIAQDALRSTGTSAFASRQFSTLSGGEKQRVVIASALAQLETLATGDTALEDRRRPATPILFLDEPTASLDLRYQLEVEHLVKRLNEERGMTIVLSTHDLRLAQALCTEVVLLSNGRILAHGAALDVLTPTLVGALYDIDPAVAAPLLS